MFGPDYAHQKGTGFGHYAGLIPHIENGTLVTGAAAAAAAAHVRACLPAGLQQACTLTTAATLSSERIQGLPLTHSTCTGQYNGAQPEGPARAMSIPLVLAGAAVGMALLLLSAAVLVVRRRKLAGYAQLQGQEGPTTAFVQPV